MILPSLSALQDHYVTALWEVIMTFLWLILRVRLLQSGALKRAVLHVAFSPDGTQLAAVGQDDDHTLCVFKVRYLLAIAFAFARCHASLPECAHLHPLAPSEWQLIDSMVLTRGCLCDAALIACHHRIGSKVRPHPPSPPKPPATSCWDWRSPTSSLSPWV